ncbi:MAG: hypothetical protein ACRECW_03535 [Phyllobacterium sp.]
MQDGLDLLFFSVGLQRRYCEYQKKMNEKLPSFCGPVVATGSSDQIIFKKFGRVVLLTHAQRIFQLLRTRTILSPGRRGLKGFCVKPPEIKVFGNCAAGT